MAKTTRHLVAGLVMTGLLAAGRPVLAADEEASGLGHVRSHGASILAAIQQASERSKTFRGLMEAINASDAIVYIEQGECGKGVRACFVNVTIAGSHRVLWVKVDGRKTDVDLMGSIGHELRHTVEVLSDRSVTSMVTLYFFYQHVGQNGGRAFETAAAVEAGYAVRAELRHRSPGTDAR